MFALLNPRLWFAVPFAVVLAVSHGSPTRQDGKGPR